MAVTGQRQFASVVTALSQDAFVGSSIENGATILACDLRKRDVPRALGTTALICWRKAPYHVDMHTRSTCHHPMLSRCIGAPGAYRDGQNPRRDCTPARQGVSTSQQMSHSILRLSWALAVVCGVSRRHLALRCSGLFLIPMPKSSMKRWVDDLGSQVPPPEERLRPLLAIPPAPEGSLDGDDPLGTDTCVMGGKDEQARLRMPHEAASEHGEDTRQFLPR